MKNIFSYLYIISKSVIIALFILCFTTIKTFSQSNIYYPVDTTGMWHQSTFEPIDLQNFNYYSYTLFIYGDTLINTIHYHKMYANGIKNSIQQNTHVDTTTNYVNEYEGAYRNDSINNKIYFVIPSQTSETLWYDFNVNINNNLTPTITVTSIDSIFIGTHYRKQIHTNSNNGTYIEGIGNKLGFFKQYTGNMDAFNSNHDTLYCFSVNGNALYPNDSCIIPTSIQVIKHASEFSIYPNPVNNILNINTINSIKTISIKDIVGREILYLSENESHVIDVSILKAGIYFINAIISKENFTAKFIKVN